METVEPQSSGTVPHGSDEVYRQHGVHVDDVVVDGKEIHEHDEGQDPNDGGSDARGHHHARP